MKSIIQTIRQAMLDKTTTARAQVEQAFAKAAEHEQYNALLSLTKERALERADAIDQQVARGEAVGALAGVPFVVKDNFLAFGAPTTAASRMLADFDAPMQATVVDRLEAAGAICIGKANLDAFAHGGSTENSAFGVTKNAVDKERVAGGSSGGSAVVTALDIVPFALGSDTGGSIRQPASFNGVYGMKPTYGAVSRYGVVAMASSTDSIGCFAQTAFDTDLVMRTMAGVDKNDMTTIGGCYEAPLSTPDKMRIGVVTSTMTDGLDGDVRLKTQEYIDALKAEGHEVVEVSMEMLRHALAVYYIVVPAEVSSNLARYDGVRYGHRSKEISTLAELYARSRSEGFVTENKRRIMIGSYVLSAGYFDAYYQKAQKVRTLLIEEYAKVFEQCDVLVSPVTPTTAFKIGERTDDPLQMYLADTMTVPASLAGLPAVSVPAGVGDGGLPIGVQLTAKRGNDVMLLSLAQQMEDKTNG